MGDPCDNANIGYLQYALAVIDRAASYHTFCVTTRGNVRSAADAQHIAAEFLSRFKLERQPARIVKFESFREVDSRPF